MDAKPLTATTATPTADLRSRLAAVEAEVADRAARRMARWEPRIRRADFRASAANLADWLALRDIDLTSVQDSLTFHGLSTLGRLDGHVRPSIAAVRAALDRICGDATAAFPDPAAIRGGAALLDQRRDAIFGPGADLPDDPAPESRIMVTLPSEAADDPSLVDALVAAGTDCFRINCAHDTPAAWTAMVGHIRAAETRTGRRLAVSMDLGGPKFRIARVLGDSEHHLKTGDRFSLLGPQAHHARHVSRGAQLSHAELVAALSPGATVSLDDGKLWASVTDTGPDRADLVVTRAPVKGVRLKPGKGINLPGVDLRVAALTTEDRLALDTVLRLADVVAYSFVQTTDDVDDLIDEMTARAAGRPLPAILLKIETPLALRNLPDLIVEAGGTLPVAVMIARGDLAVEIGFERLSEIQEEILWLCEAAQVPVVWATQVLETMVKEGQASRAEVTDAAMGQRAECVMLNKGPHIVAAVSFLRGVLNRMDRHQDKKRARLVPLGLWRDRP